MNVKISVYADNRRPADGYNYIIRLRFTPVGKSSFLISTGITSQYAPIDLMFPPKEPGSRHKSAQLMKIYMACQEHLLYNNDNSVVRLKAELNAIVTGRPKQKVTLESLFTKFCDGKYVGTRKMYERTIAKILSFDARADINDIDKKWLEKFEAWLRKDGANTNGISLHMRNLRAVFNYALDEEVTQNYPFRKYRIKNEQSRKRDLTAEQLRALRDYPCDDFQEIYRDMFMLIFYLCGINIGDLCMLKQENVVNGRIEYYRRKTKKYYSIRIEPEAQAIIDRHRGKNWLLSPLDTYKDYHDFMAHMNRNLKQIGMTHRHGARTTGTALLPNISTYYARHSWASIAAEIDVPMDTIAQALGHSTPYTTTDIYINRRLKKIDEANRKVIDYLNQSAL